MWLKLVLALVVAYTEVKVQVRDLVRVVGIVAPSAPRRDLYPGKIRYIEPQMVNDGKWAQETCGGYPSRGKSRESQAKFRVGTMWGL